MVPYRTKFRRTKYFVGYNFRRQAQISEIFSAEILSDKVCSKIICWRVTVDIIACHVSIVLTGEMIENLSQLFFLQVMFARKGQALDALRFYFRTNTKTNYC